jgi:hypothetical protein
MKGCGVGGVEAACGGFSHTRSGIRRSETEQPRQVEAFGPLEGVGAGPAVERRKVVSQKWLAARLKMKSAANVSQHLRRLDGMCAI